MHKVKRGLDLPITGQPRQEIEDGAKVSRVAIVAADYVGMKPKMMVDEGDTVKLGEKLFEDRKNPGVFFTAPGAGKVSAVNRGAKRALQSVVIDLSGDDAVSYDKLGDDAGAEAIRTLLQESGLWTAFRTRPFSKVPAVDSSPRAIFVTAMDSHPLSPDPAIILADRQADFERGLKAVAKLTDGKTYLCKAPGSSIPTVSGVTVEEFGGKHPAGTVGYHIHTLCPVTRGKTVWHIGYQDVARIGHLLSRGELDVDVVVSLAGPAATNPRLLRTRMGACLDELAKGEIKEGIIRQVSGSVFAGSRANGPIHGYLGRYHNQVTVLEEGLEREFLGWTMPGANKFSTIPIFVAKLFPGKKFDFTTSTNGSKRTMVPLGMYERVMPMDIMPTHLLRAISVGDIEWAEELGVLELDEEDLGLCSFVCPGKTDFGPALRDTLTTIEKEG